MASLAYALKGFVFDTVDFFLKTGVTGGSSHADEHKRFSFVEVGHVGLYSIGICRWSTRGANSPTEVVVYLAFNEPVNKNGFLLSPIIIKEMWEVSNEPDRPYYRHEPVPKKHWWSRQKYNRIPDIEINESTLEKALFKAREEAERLHGVTVEQQERIALMVKEFKYRDEALVELIVD